MAFPNFLVIGCKRAGSTLLHQLLQAHPSIYAPTRRKELWFFDVNWGKGPAWYESFFPASPEGYAAIGEVTPGYLFAPYAPARVRALLGQPKLIVMVRHPATQAWSWWQKSRRDNGFAGSFQDWLCADRLSDLATGHHLQRWLDYHPRENLLVLGFEEFIAQPRPHLLQISRHLGVEDEWPRWQELTSRRVNGSSGAPSSKLGILSRQVAARARRLGFDGIVNIGKSAAGLVVPKGGAGLPDDQIPAELVAELHARFAADIAKTEAIIEREIWPTAGKAQLKVKVPS